jgi:hypothetical protein
MSTEDASSSNANATATRVSGSGWHKRDQVACALRRLDRRDARHPQHVALGGAAGPHELERRRKHRDAPDGARVTMRYIFGGDVDHVRLAGLVEVGKMRRARPASDARASLRRGLRHRSGASRTCSRG